MIDIKNWQSAVSQLIEQNVELPMYQVEELKVAGKEQPVWLHFGGGNLYRGFHSEIAQKLANQGKLSRGIVVCETYDDEVVSKVYRAFDSQMLEVVMHEDGTLEKRLLSATADALFCHPSQDADFLKAVTYFEHPELQMVTLTITEKGYGLNTSSGDFLPIVAQDIANGPDKPQHTMAIVTSLLYARYQAGAYPIAMVSTDNFSQNGDKLQASIWSIAHEWQKKGFVSEDFVDYLKTPTSVSFPWSMIDRITPNPSSDVQRQLMAEGFSNMEVIRTEKGTNIAPFANTEVVHYLVIEDSFPNGRPDLAAAGVILTDRETVDKIDSMKVTTCLNPLHTALAVAGCLLGYTSIAQEMNDADLVEFIKKIGYNEGLPVVEHPGMIDPQKFIDEVIQQRLPNPYIPDTPQRIAADTSQKIAIRYGETLKKYVKKTGSASSLIYIPLAIALWLRYLLAVDDEGQAFTPSPDPLLEELQGQLVMEVGEQNPKIIHQQLVPILKNTRIFGNDLYEIGLGEKIEAMFQELNAEQGSVRNTIKKYVRGEA